MPFQDVNAGFYNALVDSVGLSRQHFALLQPASPVLTTNDLWNQYFNLIPPEAIFSDPALSTGAQYFDNYKALWSSLQSDAESQFESKIPQNVRDEFFDFLLNRPAPPALSQLPALFRNWAFLRHPRYANIGATALSNMLLDPIASGALRLVPYVGDPAADPPVPDRQPDWDEGIDQLKAELAAAPSRAFNYKQSTVNTNISNTWARGRSNVFFGLHRGTTTSSRISTVFSESEMEMRGSFGHITVFSPVPGSWFSSAGTQIAFSQRDVTPPWVRGALKNWTNTFDPQNGSLARFLTSLIVVDTINLTFHSLAKFTVDDITEIRTNSGGGLWPFYTSASDSGTRTQFHFADSGELTVTITSQPGVPVVLGANVFRAEEYLG
ncbi:hypothetical protein [Catenuloplanes atrovinosus]|uniref:Uncharacterized protein n=1 Tax=Catenuloplanes atrovinosus TaxID=137266 RepID=A0AAE4C9X3_9ACTN|nr:hypothetical protein [Catenuloplanes atrovinosus]MDR7276478.1 hypothetical protein [Catenuloplanes atrovinosus]